MLGLQSGKILDIGCGTGYSTQILVDQGFKVKGIDPNERMIQRAVARGLDCKVGSFESIPFDDGEFEGIVSISALQWVKNFNVAAREMARVLKPGGKAVIQFYPDSEKEGLRIAKVFTQVGGFRGEIAIDHPENPKKKKVYLVLER